MKRFLFQQGYNVNNLSDFVRYYKVSDFGQVEINKMFFLFFRSLIYIENIFKNICYVVIFFVL